MRIFVTLFFESSLYIHCSLSRWVHKCWVFWTVGFLCHLLIIFTMNCCSSDFHPAVPTQFCNLPYVSIIYWKLRVSCLKIFSYIRQVFVWNVWCCTVSNFYHARDISIIFCSGDGFLFVCLSELLSGNLMCIVELISTGDGEIMETLDSIGIKLFVLAALKEH